MFNYLKRGIIFIAFACGLVSQTFAATFTVTDTADTSATNTLRWAINQANSTGGTDTIVLAPGQSFSVATALPVISDQVVINGSGNTIQATGSFVLFTFGAGSDGSTMQYLILNNSSNGNGRGIDIMASNCTVQGCIIGTDWNESTIVGFTDGILIDGYGNLIGGNGSAGQGNIVSANGSTGIIISDGEGNSVCGNVVGLDMGQDTDLGNGIAGIANFSCDENAIGLPVSGWGNVISGNDNYGIYLSGDKVTIQNNLIGPNNDGNATFSNGSGIYISSSTLCQIGGDSTANAGNIISGNSGYGVYSDGGSGNTICGNIIGLNAAQNLDWGNGDAGIQFYSSHNNYIGAPVTGWGNVIGGNDYGINMSNSNNNRIQNNNIGLNSSGSDFGNVGAGIWMFGSDSNLIGGNSAGGASNIISGNGDNGIGLYNDCNGNTIAGNVIGLDGTQSIARGNDNSGIAIGGTGSGFNQIGLPTSGWGNMISANSSYGINMGPGHGNNKIQGNIIGTNLSGADFGNTQGIYLNGSDSNLIGGDGGSGAGNVISGNNSGGSTGVGINIASGRGNSICGNNIGLSSDQTTAISNYRGIQVATANNTIGQPIAGWGNIICGNTYGIDVLDAGNNTVIQNNLVGLNGYGTTIPNTYCGAWLRSDFNIIGGRLNAVHNERNVISGNTNGQIILTGSAGTTVSGNYINTSLDGATAFGTLSENAGIYLDMSGNNLVGGSNSDTNNLRGNIVNSSTYGVRLVNAASNGNTITGNFVNVLADGTIAGSDMMTGIFVEDNANGNLIGTKGSGDGNLIAGADIGVYALSSGAVNNGIYGNTITAFSSAGISLSGGGNGSKAAPVITSINGSAVSGTCSGATDYIEIFKAEPGAGNGGSLTYLGSVTASGGTWSTTVPSLGGDYVCATASDVNNNTSTFSANVQNTGPTPTITMTATVTQTPTASPTPTVSATSTGTPDYTATPTVTVTQTMTVTPTEADTIDEAIFKGNAAIAYPNPGKDKVTIAVKESLIGTVLVRIYNVSGEKVAELTIDNTQTAEWLTSDIGPGIYLYQVIVNDNVEGTYKIAIVK